MISNINGDNCSKEQTINDLLQMIEARYSIEFKRANLRFINYNPCAYNNQAFCTIKQAMQNNEFIVQDLNGTRFRGQSLDVKANQTGSIDEVPFGDNMISYRVVNAKLSSYETIKSELNDSKKEIARLNNYIEKLEHRSSVDQAILLAEIENLKQTIKSNKRSLDEEDDNSQLKQLNHRVKAKDKELVQASEIAAKKEF